MHKNLPFEVLNALYHKRLFSKDELKEISEALDTFSFDLFSLKGDFAKKAVEVSVENNITVYDTVYISLTILKKTRMYTFDKQLIRRLVKNILSL